MEFLPEEVITELATILAVDPAFAEKDGVAVQVLSRLNKISTPKASLVFGRGTSLSKAHGIIERFSEDLDFRVWPTNGAGNLNQGARKRFRHKVLAELKDMEKEGGITLEAPETGGNYLKIKLNYHQVFDLPRALRKSLLLEFSFTPLQRAPESYSVSSFYHKEAGKPPEASIDCVSPLEIAADKLSALIWRVQKRDRADENDDPALVRHIHDLAYLQPLVCDPRSIRSFESMVLASVESDGLTGKRAVDGGLRLNVTRLIEILSQDRLYETEYEKFVAAMGYGEESVMISYQPALDRLNLIITGLFSNEP